MLPYCVCILTRGAFLVCFAIHEQGFSASTDTQVVIDNIVASHKRIREEFRPTRVFCSLEEREAPGKKKVTQAKEFDRREGNTLAITELEIWGANARYEFHIQRRAPQTPWTILDLERRSEKALSSRAVVITLTQNIFTKFLTANHIPIDELLTHPDSEIVSCSRTREAEGEGIQVEVKFRNPTAKLKSGLDVRFAKTTLIFVPEKSGWIPTRVIMIGPENDGLTFFNSNFTPFGELVLPLQCAVVGKLTNGTEWELAKSTSTLSFEEVPEKVFHLTAYGLPEPSFSQPSRGRLWAFCITGILLAACIVLLVNRHYRDRQQSA